jgi:SAM-dependent methyltransferase
MFDGESFDLSRCTQCGLLHTDDDLTAEDLVSYYTYDGGADAGQRFVGVLEPLMRALRRGRVRQITGRGTRPGKALDVGCGRGVMLGALAERGWDVYGTEVDAAVAASARARHGDRIFIGELTTLDLEAAPFDLITFWHVLEHLEDPLGALRRAASMLAPGGAVVVGVPNVASWQARFASTRWLHLDVPRHRWHFSVPTLGRLAERAGLSLRDVSHFSLEYGPYGWLQSALARAGLGFGLFTDILRPRGSRRWGDPRLLAHAALAGPIAAAGLLSFPLEVAAAAANAGGAIVATLRRPGAEP